MKPWDGYAPEVRKLAAAVKIELAAKIELLEEFGPTLKRPQTDPLHDFRHANMKKLRFKADDGIWRVAYAFGPERKAIFLISGDQSGTSEKRFYRELIRKADLRFDYPLEELKQG